MSDPEKDEDMSKVYEKRIQTLELLEHFARDFKQILPTDHSKGLHAGVLMALSLMRGATMEDMIQVMK